jgi:hypothetical protein
MGSNGKGPEPRQAQGNLKDLETLVCYIFAVAYLCLCHVRDYRIHSAKKGAMYNNMYYSKQYMHGQQF